MGQHMGIQLQQELYVDNKREEKDFVQCTLVSRTWDQYLIEFSKGPVGKCCAPCSPAEGPRTIAAGPASAAQSIMGVWATSKAGR